LGSCWVVSGWWLVAGGWWLVSAVSMDNSRQQPAAVLLSIATLSTANFGAHHEHITA
jgi:hypothetical protein